MHATLIVLREKGCHTNLLESLRERERERERKNIPFLSIFIKKYYILSAGATATHTVFMYEHIEQASLCTAAPVGGDLGGHVYNFARNDWPEQVRFYSGT